VVGFIVAALLAAGCSGHPTSTGRTFEPGRAGVLTVATAVLPAPGFWVPTPGDRYSGFEADLVHELAERLDLAEVRIVQVPFGDLLDGQLGDADLAVSQLTPSDEREERLDFSTPYASAAPTVLVRTGVVDTPADAALLKDLRWAVLDRSTLTAVVEDRVVPDATPLVVDSRMALLEAIRSGRVDAGMFDLPVAQALAREEPFTFEVVGQLSGDEGLAAALPEASPNLDAVDAALRQMRADGTLDDLTERWFGGTGDDVPLIRVSE
jgi:polar amino acid transport system substrate-binding protein